MRYLVYLISIAAFLLDGGFSTCSSCSGKATPTPPSAMAWEADGTAWQATSVRNQALLSAVSLSAKGSSNIVAGEPEISLSVPPVVGTYSFSTTSDESASYQVWDGNTMHRYYAGPDAGTLLGSGTIVVTNITANQVSGTFHFTGVETGTGTTKTISNGTFTANL